MKKDYHSDFEGCAWGAVGITAVWVGMRVQENKETRNFLSE
jgi:hypothetical protein